MNVLDVWNSSRDFERDTKIMYEFPAPDPAKEANLGLVLEVFRLTHSVLTTRDDVDRFSHI